MLNAEYLKNIENHDKKSHNPKIYFPYINGNQRYLIFIYGN